VVKTIPSGFRVVNGTPKELWTNLEYDNLWMAKLKNEIVRREWTYVLSSDDGIARFAVGIVFYGARPRIHVLPGDASTLVNDSELVGSRLEGPCDRATCL